jgi:hypothetical protein
MFPILDQSLEYEDAAAFRHTIRMQLCHDEAANEAE